MIPLSIFWGGRRSRDGFQRRRCSRKKVGDGEGEKAKRSIIPQKNVKPNIHISPRLAHLFAITLFQ